MYAPDQLEALKAVEEVVCASQALLIAVDADSGDVRRHLHRD